MLFVYVVNAYKCLVFVCSKCTCVVWCRLQCMHIFSSNAIKHAFIMGNMQVVSSWPSLLAMSYYGVLQDVFVLCSCICACLCICTCSRSCLQVPQTCGGEEEANEASKFTPLHVYNVCVGVRVWLSFVSVSVDVWHMFTMWLFPRAQQSWRLHGNFVLS